MTNLHKSPLDVGAEWEKRRRRHWTAAGISGVVVLGLLLSAFLYHRATGEEPPWFFTILLYGWFAGVLVFVARNTRCPACGKQPGGAFQSAWRLKTCRNCSTELRS